MRKYPEVPGWCSSFWHCLLVLGVIGIKVCHIGLPIWAIAVALIFPMLVILPTGIIQAVTSQEIPATVLENFLLDI